MCMACEEMALFHAYLDQIEEEKRRAQPWECEVTLIGDDGRPRPQSPQPSASGGSGFSCDET